MLERKPPGIATRPVVRILKTLLKKGAPLKIDLISSPFVPIKDLNGPRRSGPAHRLAAGCPALHIPHDAIYASKIRTAPTQ